MGASDPNATSFSTLTHARLRVLQGDGAGAAALLREILEADPDQREARELLREAERRGRLDAAGRIRRLEAWLAAIRREG